MKHLASKSQKKFDRVMHEFGEGTLKSHGQPVTDHKQAVAIAFSAARKVYPNYGMKDGGPVKSVAMKGIFYLDADPDQMFYGYTFGDNWNGWDIPYFEKEQADAIMKFLDGEYKNGKYLFDSGYDDENEEYEKETINTVDGPKEVYPIGAGYWTWNSPEKIKFVVIDENTLAYVNPDATDRAYPLRVSVIKGGTGSEGNPIYLQDKKVRHATKKDFDEYRVSLEGYAKDSRYESVMKNGGSISSSKAVELAQIYSKGTAKQLWEAWTTDNRIHFLMDHAVEYFELMGDDYYKSSSGFASLSYDALPSPIRKSVLIHHAQGMYKDGGSIMKRLPHGLGREFMQIAPSEIKKYRKGTDVYSLNLTDGMDMVITNDTDIKALVDSGNYAFGVRKYSKEGGSMTNGGGVDDGVNLFEDPENIPSKVQSVLDKYAQGFEDVDYNEMKKAKQELEEIGYTFEYGLDGTPFNLHKIKKSSGGSMANGGEVYVDMQRRKYVLIDTRTKQRWANEYFSNPDEAIAFAKQNNIKVIDKPLNSKGVKLTMANAEGAIIKKKNADEFDIPLKVMTKYEDEIGVGALEATRPIMTIHKNQFYKWEIIDPKKYSGGSMANGGGIEDIYYIFEGYDHHKGKPLYQVTSKVNDYVGEWHTNRADAEKELQDLVAVKIIPAPKSMSKEAVLAYNDVASGISEKEFYKKHPVGDYLQYKELVKKNPLIKYEMADGGGIETPQQKLIGKLTDIRIDLEDEDEEILANVSGQLEEATSEQVSKILSDNEKYLDKISDKNVLAEIKKSIMQYTNSIKSPGGRGFFGLEKGQPVKSSADVQVGDIILSHSDQFNADNTIKITDKKTYGTNTHLSGIYWNPITNKRIGNEDLGIDPELNPNEYYWPKQKTKMNLSPAKQKLLNRINTLKESKSNAGESAQKAIQKKIDVLQRQFDYNPSAKEKAMANKGKFALDVPAEYSKGIYKKLWSIQVHPRIHKLNDTHSIVVNSKVSLEKAYEIYSDMLKQKKEKVPALSRISRKL